MKPIRQQFADTMLEVGKEDPNLVVMVGDISHFRLQAFAKACPGRFYNIGICEPTMISMGAGLTKAGLCPVMHTIAPFIVERSFEQIKLDFCYQRLAGNIITVGSAFDYSNLGCTHHCYHDAALFKSLEGTEVIYPGSSLEFDLLFRQTYRDDKLTLIRIPEYSHDYEFSASQIRFGKGIKVTEGTNLTIVATGPHLRTALKAREPLAAAGWQAEIIYIHTLHPLDTDLILESINKTKRVLVIEEHVRTGGLAADILFHARHLNGIDYSFVCIPDEFVRRYGTYSELCAALGFTAEGIVSRVMEWKRE